MVYWVAHTFRNITYYILPVKPKVFKQTKRLENVWEPKMYIKLVRKLHSELASQLVTW